MKTLALLAIPGLAFAGWFSSGPTVTISPTTATTNYMQRVNLTVKITGKGGAEGVIWATSAGTIVPGSGGATFIPPMACGVATVTAVAKANSSKTATAKITVNSSHAERNQGESVERQHHGWTIRAV